MLSYLLQFKKRLEFACLFVCLLFFSTPSKIPTPHESTKLVENLQHLHITTEQNLNSNHCLKKPRIQCFEIHCLNVPLT